jgi:CRP-like cAMP-binding protein
VALPIQTPRPTCDRLIARSLGSDQFSAAFLSLSRPRIFPVGEVIFHRHDRADALHIVGGGRVGLRLNRTEGNVTLLRVVLPGETLADHLLSHLAGHGSDVHPLTAFALDETYTRSIRTSDLMTLIDGHPRCMYRFTTRVLSPWLDPASRLSDSHWDSADRRVRKAVRDLAACYRDETTDGAVIKMTHDMIASYAGVNRSTATTALIAGQDRGYVRLNRGYISIENVSALNDWVSR